MEKIKSIGIVGYGLAGGLHAEANRFHADKIFIFDTDPHQRDLAKANRYSPLLSLQELMEQKPEGIILAVPASCNLELVRIIANHQHKPAGLLIEKPLAPTLEEAQAIQKEIQRCGIPTMVGFTGHFHPEYKRAKELILAGLIGDVSDITEQLVIGGDNLSKYTTAEQGGVIAENGIHTLDHILHLTGDTSWKVVRASQAFAQWQGEKPDWAQIVLSSDKTKAQVDLSFPRLPKFDVFDYTTTIIGEKGYIKIRGFESISVVTPDGCGKLKFHDASTSLRDRHLPGFEVEGMAFLKMINDGISPIPISYAVRVHTLLELIEKSAKTISVSS